MLRVLEVLATKLQLKMLVTLAFLSYFLAGHALTTAVTYNGTEDTAPNSGNLSLTTVVDREKVNFLCEFRKTL